VRECGPALVEGPDRRHAERRNAEPGRVAAVEEVEAEAVVEAVVVEALVGVVEAVGVEVEAGVVEAEEAEAVVEGEVAVAAQRLFRGA
jgi:hypothetical protein